MPERWLLIASRAPATRARALWDDARDLAATGADVALLLTDDTTCEAVLPGPVPELAADGVTVLVDRVAAARRGLLDRLAAAGFGPDRLLDRAAVAGLLLDPQLRTVWR